MCPKHGSASREVLAGGVSCGRVCGTSEARGREGFPSCSPQPLAASCAWCAPRVRFWFRLAGSVAWSTAGLPLGLCSSATTVQWEGFEPRTRYVLGRVTARKRQGEKRSPAVALQPPGSLVPTPRGPRADSHRDDSASRARRARGSFSFFRNRGKGPCPDPSIQRHTHVTPLTSRSRSMPSRRCSRGME